MNTTFSDQISLLSKASYSHIRQLCYIPGLTSIPRNSISHYISETVPDMDTVTMEI